MDKSKSSKLRPEIEPPKGNLWFFGGSSVLALANNLYIQKHGNDVSDVLIYGVYVFAFLVLLVGVVRLERFREAGGRIKEYARKHPVSLGMVALLLLIVFYSTTATLMSRFRSQSNSVKVAEQPQEKPPVASPTMPPNEIQPSQSKPQHHLPIPSLPKGTKGNAGEGNFAMFLTPPATKDQASRKIRDLLKEYKLSHRAISSQVDDEELLWLNRRLAGIAVLQRPEVAKQPCSLGTIHIGKLVDQDSKNVVNTTGKAPCITIDDAEVNHTDNVIQTNEKPKTENPPEESTQ
jgi:hypothetical protein